MEAESRFNSLNAQDFEALVADKDSESTKKIYKSSCRTILEVFGRNDNLLYSDGLTIFLAPGA